METANTERRNTSPRYVFEMPVSAEWRGPGYEVQRVRAVGHTANIGPGGALVHLRPLPQVGSLVRLFINHAEAPAIPFYEAETFVLRVDHDAGEPLAALMVSEWPISVPGSSWLERVYEPSAEAIRAALEPAFTYSVKDGEEDEDGDL